MATQATAEVFLARLEARTAPVEGEQLQRSFQPAKVATAPPTSSLGAHGRCLRAGQGVVDLPPNQIDHLRRRGIKPRIARRQIESSIQLGRAVGRSSRSLSWLSCFRRLQVRWDRDSGRWFAFVLVACAVVCFNRL